MKKSLSVLLFVILIGSMLISGCSSGAKSTPTTAAVLTSTETTEVKSEKEATSSVIPSTESKTVETGSGAKKLKVALILSGPANDQGWNATALEGLQAAEKEFGVETSKMENVDIADSEAAFRDYAAQGFDLIIGHGYQFGEPAKKVSADFPNSYFVATEANSQSENMASYVMSCEQAAYLMGMLCAGMSKTKVIGVVGGFEQPSITKELEAFKLGAKEVVPDIKVLEVYINSFVDASLGKEAAMSMIRQNADVLYHVANQAGTGVIMAAQENGLLACGNSYDQSSIAPDTVMASTVYRMPKVITTAVNQVKTGTFKGGVYHLGFADDVVDITGYGKFEDKIPQDLKDKIAAKKEAIRTGEFVVPVIEKPTK